MGFRSVDSVPTTIGKYRLLAELGHGGMARVFLAVAHGPSGFSKLVVLKMIRMHLADDPDTLQMFLDEGRLAGRLNHPNVVHTLEVAEEHGRYIMVMEYLDGQSFASILRRARHEKSPLPMPLHLRGLSDALQGLHYAHELRDFDGTHLNLIHRDVSPQNVFVTYDGQVKIVDFGIAKAITSSLETKAGVIKGKIAYMAPEQFLGEKLDRRVDIYGMGAVLWQAATGQRLWRGVPDGQVIHQVVRGDMPRPSSVNPDVHPELERVVVRALARERDDRYSNCLELQEDLERVIEALGGKVTGRQLGTHLALMFDDVRREIASTIERQLSKAQSYDTHSFDQTQIPAILSTTIPGGVLATESSGRFGTRGSGPGLRVISLTSGAENEVISASYKTNALALSNSIPGAGPTPKNPNRVWVLAVAAVVLLFGFGAALWLTSSLWRASAGDAAVATLPASSSAPVATEPPPSPTLVPLEASVGEAQAVREVEIRIKADPKHARIFFDDSELATNPATRRVRESGEAHKVRVEANGYGSQEIEVAAEKDVVVNIELERVRAIPRNYQPPPIREPKEPPTATAPPTSPRPPTSARDDPSARDRIQNLDKTNPWED